MKFELDENLSPTLAKDFESSGHEAHSIVAQSLGGQSDDRVIEVCLREQRALTFCGIFDVDAQLARFAQCTKPKEFAR